MKKIKYFVFDTNSLISAFLIRSSKNAQALDKAIQSGRLVISYPCLQEFSEVIFREKFDPYFANEQERLKAIEKVELNSVFIFPKEEIRSCRDQKDDKFLELAVAAAAKCIITGDKDLLQLNPFRGIRILSPADFLSSKVIPDEL